MGGMGDGDGMGWAAFAVKCLGFVRARLDWIRTGIRD